LHQKIDGKIISIHGFHATGGMLGVHTYYSSALTCSTTRHSLRLLAATQTDPRPIKDPLRRKQPLCGSARIPVRPIGLRP
jgi:hypothetical protein